MNFNTIAMKTGILTLLLLFSVSQISWSQSRSERKALKLEKAQKAYEQTKSVIDNITYVFDAEWMYPRNSSQVNLINNPGFIKFKSDNQLDMYLPYFGVIRIGGGLTQPAGIQHKGEITSYKVVHNDDKQSSIITFQAKTSTELYDISMTVYSSGTTSIFVSSSKRDGIRYRGQISALEEEAITKN